MADDEMHLDLPDPVGLLETFDAIRKLRADAQSELDDSEYEHDPTGFTARLVKAMRGHADDLEMDMEARLGWVRTRT